MPTSSALAILLDNVSARVDGALVLRGVTLSLHAGEILGLVGPSGAGKSSLLRLIAGQIRPEEGDLLVLGLPSRKLSRGAVAYLPAHDALSPRHRVKDEAQVFGALRGLASADVVRWARDWQKRFVADTSGKRVGALPDGLRRCVELSECLAGLPMVALLDGPFSGMGGALASASLIAIAEAASRGATVVIADARLDLLESLCTRIAVLTQGKIVHDGMPGAIAGVAAGRAWMIRTDADLSGCPLVERALPLGRDTRVTLIEGASREAFLRWILDQNGRIESLRPARSLADVLSDTEG